MTVREYARANGICEKTVLRRLARGQIAGTRDSAGHWDVEPAGMKETDRQEEWTPHLLAHERPRQTTRPHSASKRGAASPAHVACQQSSQASQQARQASEDCQAVRPRPGWDIGQGTKEDIWQRTGGDNQLRSALGLLCMAALPRMSNETRAFEKYDRPEFERTCVPALSIRYTGTLPKHELRQEFEPCAPFLSTGHWEERMDRIFEPESTDQCYQRDNQPISDAACATILGTDVKTLAVFVDCGYIEKGPDGFAPEAIADYLASH